MLLAVYKPTGITSFRAISFLRAFFHEKKIGHCGTLDPMASGLLLVGVSREGTKQLTLLQGLSKEYVATIDFAKQSDTRDMEYRDYYEEFDPVSFQAPSLEVITNKLQSLIPTSLLPLPGFSSKKVAGKKMYDLARKGQAIAQDKQMDVNRFEILSYDFPILKLKLGVGSGTYIRAIAHWLGEQCGTAGILTSLERTSIGHTILDTKNMKPVFDTGVLYEEIEDITSVLA